MGMGVSGWRWLGRLSRLGLGWVLGLAWVLGLLPAALGRIVQDFFRHGAPARFTGCMKCFGFWGMGACGNFLMG